MMRTSSEILDKQDNYTEMLFHEFIGNKNKKATTSVFREKNPSG